MIIADNPNDYDTDSWLVTTDNNLHNIYLSIPGRNVNRQCPVPCTSSEPNRVSSSRKHASRLLVTTNKCKTDRQR